MNRYLIETHTEQNCRDLMTWLMRLDTSIISTGLHGGVCTVAGPPSRPRKQNRRRGSLCRL